MKVKALVISEDHYNALGVIRSLGEEKIPVDLILTTESKKTFVDKSKYISNTVRVSHDDDRIIEAIITLSEEADYCYLFPLSDYSAMLIDKRFEEFGNSIVCPNMKGNMLTFQNKIVSKELATQCGMKTAKSTLHIMGEPINWSIFPAIIKPLVSQEGAKSDISIVKSFQELKETLGKFSMKNYKQVLIEEYLTGKSEKMIEVLGCRCNDSVLIGGIVSKIREYPMYRGSTSYAEIVFEQNGIDIDAVKKYIRKTDFDGLFDVEFKYVDGVCYFIECNFRNGAPSYALTQFGCNLPYNWIAGKNGEVIKTIKKTDSRMLFMCEQTDFLNAIKKEITFKQWFMDYKTARKVFKGENDISPVINYYLQFFGMLFKRIARR